MKASAKNSRSPGKTRRRRPSRPVLLQDEERHKLLYGPYEPPLVKGGFLVDAVRGKLPFGTFSNALIPWPKARRGKKSGSGGFILCGDLVRALKKESALAISHHWGVSRATVTNWRQALGLTSRTQRTPGAQRLVDLGVELARLPQSRKKIAEAARGRVMPPFQKLRLFGGIDKGWRKRFKARRAAYRRTGRFPKAAKSDPWIPEEEKLLPKMSTRELVQVLGRSAKSIQHRRTHLGITAAPPPSRRPWRKGEIQLLGTAPDRVIAERLGRTISLVKKKRRQLGIKTASEFFWTPKEEAIIGKVPDAEAARRLGRSEHAVRHRRGKLGMAFFRVENRRQWSASEEVLLGTDTDSAIAGKLERTVSAVAMKRREKGIPIKPKERPWTQREIALLGTMSDRELARKLKRTISAVTNKRYKCGVSPGTNRRWTPAEDKLLGTMPDEEVARELGRTVGSVGGRRLKLGIPIFRSKR